MYDDDDDDDDGSKGSVGRKHHTHTTEQDRTIAKVGEVRGARAELLLYLVLNERRERRRC